MVSFYIYREDKVIKKASPVFCQLMLVGIILVCSSIVLWACPPSTPMCIIKVWVLAVGFGLIMGNLLAKTFRIFKIFTDTSVASSVLTDATLLKFSGAVIAVELVLLSLLTFASGTLFQSVVVRSTTDSLYSYYSCEVPGKYLFQTSFTISIMAFNAALVIVGAFLAFVSRKVDSDFNESGTIGATMYFYIIISFVFLTLYYTNGDSTGSAGMQFMERSIAILGAMAFTLLALFVPKLLEVYRRLTKESETNPGRRLSSSGRIDSNPASAYSLIPAIGSHRTAYAGQPPPPFLSSGIWPLIKRRRLGLPARSASEASPPPSE